MSFLGSRKICKGRKIRVYEAKGSNLVVKNERRQDKKAIGYKSKIALSGEINWESIVRLTLK